MANFKNNFHEYVAATFKKRLKEIGLSQNRFLDKFSDFSNRPTLRRILKGSGGTSMDTVAHYAGLLGLEIIIREKREGNGDCEEED